MMSTGMKCIKYLLFGFNLIFFLAGIILIVAGALVQTKFSDYFVFFDGKVNGAAIILIVVGVIVFTVGFLGCCGAYKENHCMVMTFAVLLGIVLVLEVAAAIVANVMRLNLEDLVRKKMGDATETYPKQGVKDAWDQAQKEMKCCGSQNYTDWSRNAGLVSNFSVPDACCITYSSGCGYGKLTNSDAKDFIYTEGCANKMLEWAQSNIFIIGGVALGLAFIQMIGVLIACCVGADIRSRKEYFPMN